MTKRDQTKLIFNMGAERLPDDFRQGVIALACELSGGCFVQGGTGFWIEGETKAARFAGTPQAEDTLVIELTCENSKLESVYDEMCHRIALKAATYGANIDWVHVSQVAMVGRHFSCKAMAAATLVA